jgi:hypothetical protein
VLPPSFLLLGAGFFCAFGAVVWLVERRRGNRLGPALLTGIPGVYLCGWASTGGPAWLYVPGVPLLAAGYLLQVIRVQRRPAGRGMAGGPAGALTGVQVTAPPPGPQPPAAGPDGRWRGSASLPCALLPSGRGQASVLMALASLTVCGATVSLRLQPRLLEKLLAVTPLSQAPAGAAQAFPVRGLRDSPGVGIIAGDSWYYFGTPARAEVLTALSEAGVSVSWAERQAPPASP